MRKLILVTLMLLTLTLASARAQNPKKTTVSNVSVGFRGSSDPDENVDGKRPTRFKAGMWTLVQATVQAGEDGLPRGSSLVVETTDSDDAQNEYIVPLPPLGPGESRVIQSYTRPSVSNDGKVVVSVRNDAQSNLASSSTSHYAMDGGQTLFVTLGSRLPALRSFKPINNAQANDGQPITNQNAEGQFDVDNNETPARVGAIDQISSMPDHWFGYEAVDLLILTTGNTDFVTNLINPQEKPRQLALSEWVRRGGKLVISAGRNQNQLPAVLKVLQMDVLPIEVVPGGAQRLRLDDVEQWLRAALPRLENKPAKVDQKIPPIELLRLKLMGDGLEKLLTTNDEEKLPLVTRVPFGMGQVTLVAFDLDTQPFSSWRGQREFWKKLQRELGALPTQVSNYNNLENRDKLAAALNGILQSEKVTNISFGWVALFIFIYILVVGPLDYFFLKKVVKRLELTWITFPTVVLIVSAGAYFTAYALKGNDLLINKADLVDIDLRGPRGGDRPGETCNVYGHSWFTLFSPRIQHYTIGLEPSAPGWFTADANDNPKAASVLMSSMGPVDDSSSGFGRTRSQSLFRRTYEYAADAAGLQGVPIQVWTTKSFTAAWKRENCPKPFGADLTFKNPKITGEITNHLPVDLQQVYLIQGPGNPGRMVFPLSGGLKAGQTLPIDIDTGHHPNRKGVQEWVKSPPGDLKPHEAKVFQVFQEMIFHELLSGKGSGTGSLRSLDETWRLHLPGEVLLFGRIARQDGPAESVTGGKESPTRLWLGELPEQGKNRPSLDGSLVQDTYVRVYIPIKNVAAGGD